MPAAAPPPAPPAPAKPAAPAPKPAAPPSKPATPPAKPPAPARSQESAFDDAFSDLDAIEAKSNGKIAAPAKSAPKKEEKPKTPDPDDGDGNTEEITDPKPNKENEPADKREDAKPEDKTVGLKELRTQYEKSKAAIKEKDTEITRLKGELDARTKGTPKVDPAIQAELESTKKRLKEYEDELRFTNYQKHPEFKEKYEKPYHEAFARALTEFEQINVTEEDGRPRKATRADLDALLRMSVAEVDRLATESFGPSAARVIRHVEKLRDLGDSYHTALEEARTKGAENEKTRASESRTAQEQRDKWWKDANDEAPKKYPQWFSPKEGDEEVNTALKKGYDFADSCFTPEPDVNPETLAKRHAAMRNRAAGFSRVVVELKRANARIAELEAAAKEIEDSEPPGGEGRASGGAVGNGRWEDDAFAELESIDKKFKR